ncbi:MAG: type II toxin-antitoxin system VapC family toxin [Gaiella sp.]|nr:type II toxin-antitoxin system VapC family toxin [Gaiella sp.]
MSFWDSSALVPTLTVEATTARMRDLLADDPAVTVWWATPVEIASALARRERIGADHRHRVAEANAALDDLASRWTEVPATDAVRSDARRLVRVHDLRAADAFQLAAARIAADGEPGALPFVTLDERLALAASREGFPLLGGG